MTGSRTLLIDDIRTLPADHVCRTYADGLAALQRERWDHLLLDHDLGEEKTGYDLMKWLEEHPEFKPGKITLITMNPVGRKNMEMAMRNLYENDIDTHT